MIVEYLAAGPCPSGVERQYPLLFEEKLKGRLRAIAYGSVEDSRFLLLGFSYAPVISIPSPLS